MTKFFALWFVGIVYIPLIFLMFRDNWVSNKRIEWINLDVYDFKERCPSHRYMIWHFWIWDMKKFGYNPLIKLEKHFAQYFYSPQELQHALKEQKHG